MSIVYMCRKSFISHLQYRNNTFVHTLQCFTGEHNVHVINYRWTIARSGHNINVQYRWTGSEHNVNVQYRWTGSEHNVHI